MHELRIAQEIISITEKEMRNQHLNAVNTIVVRLGALSGVDPEALAFGFEAGTIDTLLAGAKLTIEQVAVEGRCRSCEKCFEINDYYFLCPYCDSVNVEITRGEELYIDHLIGE
ncbi:MAG: hydrogenase maturation nickel metallochaperone HypA [candidate division Zixibacteria bacterium]|nr:hydrogenase maturation nickel metallochaperone HypA [candidate division Zixibacteria bacterium]